MKTGKKQNQLKGQMMFSCGPLSKVQKVQNRTNALEPLMKQETLAQLQWRHTGRATKSPYQ